MISTMAELHVAIHQTVLEIAGVAAEPFRELALSDAILYALDGDDCCQSER